MKASQLITLASCTLLAWASSVHAHPRVGWSVGINFGAPHCHHYHRPYGYWGYYRPYPVIVEAPPAVVVRPAPVIVREAPVIVRESPAAFQDGPVYQSSSAPAAGIDQHLQLLTSPQENVRRDAVLELGRMKATSAVDPLAATLAGDRSPIVRDAAARALGLIASPRALPALTHSAQADSDRDVRRSAQFAVEVIHSQLRR
jgi:hypothetical protein